MSVPLSIPGLQIWLDASDVTTLSALNVNEVGNFTPSVNYEPVGFWGDKSGNERHFTYLEGGLTRRPTYQITGLENNIPAIRFNNSFLTCESDILCEQQTVFVVLARNVIPVSVSVPASVYEQSVGNNISGSITNHNTFVPLKLSNADRYYCEGAGTINNAGTKGLSGFDIVTVKHSGSSGLVRLFINGYPAQGTGTQNLNNIIVTRTRLGSNILYSTKGEAVTPTQYFNGDIAEVIVYNRALTTHEQVQIETYLSTKYMIELPVAFAIKDGYWSDTTTWSTSTLPHTACNVYANGYNINIDQDINVGSLRLDTPGSDWLNINYKNGFEVTTPVSINASLSGIIPAVNVSNNGCVKNLLSSGTMFLTGSMYGDRGTCFENLSSSTAYIYGDVTGPRSYYHTILVNAGDVHIYGNVSGNFITINDCHAIYNAGGNVTVTGNVSGHGANATTSHTIACNNGSFLTVNGNVHGTLKDTFNNGSAAIYANQAQQITINGNVYGSNTYHNYGTINCAWGNLLINGNVYSGSKGGCAIYSESITSTITIHGAIYNNPVDGTVAVRAKTFSMSPSPHNSFIAFASLTSSSDPLFYYAPESYSTTYLPNVTSVRIGVEYSGTDKVGVTDVPYPVQLRGKMFIPSISTVALGVKVGDSEGIAIVNSESLQHCWLLNTLDTVSDKNTIGERIKIMSSIQDVGEQIGSVDI